MMLFISDGVINDMILGGLRGTEKYTWAVVTVTLLSCNLPRASIIRSDTHQS